VHFPSGEPIGSFCSKRGVSLLPIHRVASLGTPCRRPAPSERYRLRRPPDYSTLFQSERCNPCEHDAAAANLSFALYTPPHLNRNTSIQDGTRSREVFHRTS